MRYLTLFMSALLVAGVLGVALAQPEPKPADTPKPADGAIDEVTKKAAALEAELAKTSSTSPNAAELMLELMDLYHANGRPFGLVRVAQTFVALHSAHPKHKHGMLRLIDGLTATGRNKELIATGRQFLDRHPGDPAGAEIERWLPLLLKRDKDILGAAAILEAHWKRLGSTDEGQRAGREALQLYYAANKKESLTAAAALGEEMLDKLPAGGPATAAGWVAVDALERLSDWPKANLVASKLLKKSPPTIPYYLQTLHARMGEYSARTDQRTNAAASFRQAISVPNAPDRPDLMSRMVQELARTNPPPATLEKAVAEYVKKYPDRTDVGDNQALVAHAYLNTMDTAKAEQRFAALLPTAARSHGSVSHYVRLAADKMDEAARPAAQAQAEKTLRAAIGQSKDPANTAALRYSLAFELYRDRMKDTAKAQATARELLANSPTNDGYTSGSVNWLLDAAADDAAFQADLKRIVDARKKFPWVTTIRDSLASWAKSRQRNKDKAVAARGKAVAAALAQADADPHVAEWLAYQTAKSNSGTQAAAAEKLLAPARLNAMPDDVARGLLYQQQHYFRHYASTDKRPKSVDLAKLWTERQPDSYEAATTYLAWALDFAKEEHYKPAVDHVLKLTPTSENIDPARRMMQVARHFKDAGLAKRVWDWTKKLYETHGYTPSYASYIGETLALLELPAEAQDCWTRGMNGTTENSEVRECAARILATLPDDQKAAFLDKQLARDTAYGFSFAVWRAELMLKAGQFAEAGKLLREAADRQKDRAFGSQNFGTDYGTVLNWVNQFRAEKAFDKETPTAPADKIAVFTLVRDLDIARASMLTTPALAEVPESDVAQMPDMARLLALAGSTQHAHDGGTYDFDLFMSYAQAAMTRQDYLGAAALLSGMLANCPNIDGGRKDAGRDRLTQAYTRLGAAGGAVIDENSPIAPLLQAALQLRLGDPKLAFETYLAHRQLFDDHRADVPIDLLVFVADNHMTAGGDENHDRVEDMARSWLIANSEAKDVSNADKARVQLVLARNYFRSKRFDLARAEYTTLLNKYPGTPQATEAEFGIGETFMEQKVYDQAEHTFERLANSRDREVVVRAEFLRGVLANRRGDRDEARLIFRSVLERVPNVELANQTLYNLSEVYGAEQRYVDQLELLRTVGRLGRASKRFHTPGEPLSIVVQDSDLGVSRGHSKIPVLITTEPGGDAETIYLLSGGAGKGLFRADLETRLGSTAKDDRVLQLTGEDVIRVDYPPAFKQEFKDSPLPDAEIRIAAAGRLDIASRQIVDINEETFSERLAREAQADDDDDEELRKGLVRPTNQVKPGNPIYLRVKDADRDLTDRPDEVAVRLTSASGDQVRASLVETGPHTGIFEGAAKTGELPAGALATNTAIDHSPLMAIDKDFTSTWLSEPDGAAPKHLAVDMKDLKRVDRVTAWTPDAFDHAPVRTTLEGSEDGRLWFRLAATQLDATVQPVTGEFGPMTARIYEGMNAYRYDKWNDFVGLTKNATAVSTGPAADLFWSRPPDAGKEDRKPIAVVWSGKLVQPRTGPARFHVSGNLTAVMVDGRLELPPGPGGRTVDVYLDEGTHDLTIVAAASAKTDSLEAKWVSGDTASRTQLTPVPFRATDFDLTRPEAKTAAPARPLGTGITADDGRSWEFDFPPIDLRHVRLVIHEYTGEAVAINHIDIHDTQANVVHIPTDADLLSLATNDTLEIAGGDEVVANYIDDVNPTGNSRLLAAGLTATYHNAQVTPIGYDFVRQSNGGVATIRKQVLRVDPGERVVMEVVDFDQDLTSGPDTIRVQVAINDGEPVEFDATETDENTASSPRKSTPRRPPRMANSPSNRATESSCGTPTARTRCRGTRQSASRSSTSTSRRRDECGWSRLGRRDPQPRQKRPASP